MSEDDWDEAIAARARRELDRQLESLDDATRVRLRAARLRALDAHDARPAWRGRPALGAIAAGLVGLTLVATWWLREAPPALDGLEDVEILAATDDWELYDDLDFYRWLEEDGGAI